MAAYKMAAVKVTPPNDFPLGLIRSHMVVIHLFLMLCDLQRMVRDSCPTLYRKRATCLAHLIIFELFSLTIRGAEQRSNAAHFTGSFARLRKAIMNFVISVCPSVRMQQFAQFFLE